MYLLWWRALKITSLIFRSFFRRKHADDELDEELRYHIDRQTETNVAAGMNRRDALNAALREFAGVQQRKEECRDMRHLNLIDNLLQDIRFSVRQLLRNPAFTVTAVLVLTLGLAAAIAIFAFVDAALFKPLPYRDTARLVGVYEEHPGCEECNLSYLNFVDWRKQNSVFSCLEAYKNSGSILTTPDGAAPTLAARVSDGFFRALGVIPALGRDFYAGEDHPGAARSVLLSNAAWKKRYGGQADTVGKTVILDGEPYTIIGILPADFHFAPVGAAEFWATLDSTGSCEARRSCHNLYGVARLKDGVTIQQALADTKAMAHRLAAQYPDSNGGGSANVAALSEVIVGNIRPILLTLLGGAGLLLLIACINVASLLLVRSESRSRELAVRSALGASRGRLLAQFVTEGLLLTGAGGAAGVGCSWWIMRLLSGLIPGFMMGRMPFLEGIGLNSRVLAFAGGLSLVAAVLFALTPALRLSFRELREGLAEGSRGSAGKTWRRLGSKFVVLELATATVLLVGAGLLAQSLHCLLKVKLGFQPGHIATLIVAAPEAGYRKDEQRVQLARSIVTKVSSLPGIKSAALTSLLPVSFNGNSDWIRIVGRPYSGEHEEVNERDVSPEYFKTIGARIIRGRSFTDFDDSSKPNVAIVNDTLAKKYFPNEDPIGKKYGDIKLSPKSIRTIVGVVEDVREGSLDSEIWPAEYFPFNQSTDTSFSLVVSTSQSEDSMLGSIAEAIR